MVRTMISHPLATTPPRAASFRRYPVSTPWPRPAATASLVAALPHRGRPRDTRPAASGQPASPSVVRAADRGHVPAGAREATSSLRGDRILHEALTIGPDPLHLAMVFNLSHT